MIRIRDGLPEGFFQRAGQLIRAGGSATAAVDTFETGDGVFGFHAAYQRRDALCVAVAAAQESSPADDAVFQFDFDLLRAGAFAGVGYLLDHGFSCNSGTKITKKALPDKESSFFSAGADYFCRLLLSATTMFLSMRSVTSLSTSISSEVSFTSLTVP